MYFRFDLDAVLRSFTTYMVGWVVGKLESNAKLKAETKVEVEVGVELGNRKIDPLMTQSTHHDGIFHFFTPSLTTRKKLIHPSF